MLRTASRRGYVTDILTVIDRQASHWAILPLELRTPKGSTWSVPKQCHGVRPANSDGDRSWCCIATTRGNVIAKLMCT